MLRVGRKYDPKPALLEAPETAPPQPAAEKPEQARKKKTKKS